MVTKAQKEMTERLRQKRPDLFNNPDPVAGLEKLKSVIESLEDSLSAMRRLKQSYAAKARWSRQYKADVDRATSIDVEGNRIVDVNKLSPSAFRKVLKHVQEPSPVQVTPPEPEPLPDLPDNPEMDELIKKYIG